MVMGEWLYQFNSTDLSIQTINATSPRLTFSQLKTGALFVYHDRVYYSMDLGHSFIPIGLKPRNPNAPILPTQTLVRQLVTSKIHMQYVILTSNLRLFVGQLGLQSALEIDPGNVFTTYTDFVLDYQLDGSLIAIGTVSNGTDVVLIPIPIPSDLSVPSWNISGSSCLYYKFKSNQTSGATFYIDYGESLTISTSLITDATTSGDLSLVLPNSSLVTTQQTKSTMFGGGHAVHTSQWTLTPFDVNVPGTTSMSLVPHVQAQGCPSVPMSTVQVGCPPGYQLRMDMLNLPQVACPSTYILTAKSYLNKNGEIGESDQTVPYDCQRFGPPYLWFYGRAMAPTFSLVNAQQQTVKSVDVDFVLIESFNQTAFKYNSTLENVAYL
ncbi:hypothetical protein HMI54_006520 [Coelomomyces lativittatus]|nr:hypothetical protein HMI54_006520 [Coelomomyces lativittatus]